MTLPSAPVVSPPTGKVSDPQRLPCVETRSMPRGSPEVRGKSAYARSPRTMVKSYLACEVSQSGAADTSAEPLPMNHFHAPSTASTAPPPTTAWSRTRLPLPSTPVPMVKNGVIGVPAASSQRPTMSEVLEPLRQSSKVLPFASPTAARKSQLYWTVAEFVLWPVESYRRTVRSPGGPALQPWVATTTPFGQDRNTAGPASSLPTTSCCCRVPSGSQ